MLYYMSFIKMVHMAPACLGLMNRDEAATGQSMCERLAYFAK